MFMSGAQHGPRGGLAEVGRRLMAAFRTAWHYSSRGLLWRGKTPLEPPAQGPSWPGQEPAYTRAYEWSHIQARRRLTKRCCCACSGVLPPPSRSAASITP